MKIRPQPIKVAYADGTLQIWRHSSDSLLLGVTTVEPGGKLRRASLWHYRGNRIFVDRGLEYSAFEGGYFDARGAAHYYHTDYRGNIVMVTDSTGAVTQRASYYPYGEPHRLPEGQPYLFAAKERHSRTGATLFGPRDLLTAALLWTAPDALAGQNKSGSPWAYCNANPVLFIDHTGKKLEMAKDLTWEDVSEILFNLQCLSDDKFFINKVKEGAWQVNISEYSFNGSKENGTNLIREIIKHPGTVIIDYLNSQNLFPESKQKSNLAKSYKFLPKYLTEQGVKSVVNFNYRKKSSSWIFDPDGNISHQTHPQYISLGHELIHALHHLNGNNVHHSKTGINPYRKNSVNIEELWTVGLLDYNMVITENCLRAEHGIPLRISY